MSLVFADNDYLSRVKQEMTIGTDALRPHLFLVLPDGTVDVNEERQVILEQTLPFSTYLFILWDKIIIFPLGK